jgi:hypothetical protein
MIPTPQQLKQKMDAVWADHGCRVPLRKARWRVTQYGDLDYGDPFVLDEDDGDPLLAEEAVDSDPG